MASVELAFPLPNAPHTRVNLHLTQHAHALVLFLGLSGEGGSGAGNLGSFVYAIPDISTARALPMSTPLYPQLDTVDFATRLAKVLARKLGKPTYVASSVTFTSAGKGGDIEEEMAGFKKIVEVVMQQVSTVSN